MALIPFASTEWDILLSCWAMDLWKCEILFQYIFRSLELNEPSLAIPIFRFSVQLETENHDIDLFVLNIIVRFTMFEISLLQMKK